MRYQVQIPLGGLPVNLVLVGNKEDGQVVFVKVVPEFKAIIDFSGDVEATFMNDGFWLGLDMENTEWYNYNMLYRYKEIPYMLQWLQQQNLSEPRNVTWG